DLYWDSNHNYWRVFEFIENGKMLSNAETAEQAKETAKGFAEFTAAFNDFDVTTLKDTIPNFHSLAFRHQQFKDSLKNQLANRIKKAGELIEQLKQRSSYV